MAFRTADIEDAMVGDYSLSTLEADLQHIIVEELPRDLSSMFGLHVEMKVTGKRYTSLTVFFTAALVAYPLIASYHDFVDSVHLIKKHCALLVEALDESKYGGILSPSVEVYYPSLHDPSDYRWMHNMFSHPEGDMFAAAAFTQTSVEHHRRDLFFWSLVVMNLVLLALVGSLVYRSVVSTYFFEPTKITTPARESTTTAPARMTKASP
jgi:hypothetical protein